MSSDCDMDMVLQNESLATTRFSSIASAASSPPRLDRLVASSASEDLDSRDRWDEDAASCAICNTLLGRRRLRPRHHCRICGRCVCASCSPSMVAMPGCKDLQRACSPCLTIACRAPAFKSRLSQLGAKLVSLASSRAMEIPLGSLDAMLAVCEDALAPLEGLAAQLVEVKLQAKQAAAEAEQERGRARRLEARLKSAAESLAGLSGRLRDWLEGDGQGCVDKSEDHRLQPISLEEAVLDCTSLVSRVEETPKPKPKCKPQPTTCEIGSSEWQPNSSECNLCGTTLGKRHLRPRHHCRFCGRCVCGNCSRSSIAGTSQRSQRCCAKCIEPVAESRMLWRRLTRLAEAISRHSPLTQACSLDQVLQECEAALALPQASNCTS
ncbi:unnamed protein product [Effrenium voratum]|nr:unnamed protein product [Effrenium voratum]